MSGTSKSDLTPYYASQVATAVLRKAGVLDEDQEISSQSMYSNKTIKKYGTPRRNGGDGYMFDGDSFYEWLEGMKAGVRTARQHVNVSKLVKEYDESEEDEATETSVTDDEDPTELEQVLAASIAAREADEPEAE